MLYPLQSPGATEKKQQAHRTLMTGSRANTAAAAPRAKEGKKNKSKPELLLPAWSTADHPSATVHSKKHSMQRVLSCQISFSTGTCGAPSPSPETRFSARLYLEGHEQGRPSSCRSMAESTATTA